MVSLAFRRAVEAVMARLFSGGISLGTNPAALGIIRIPKNIWITARNAANDADLNLIGTDGSDHIWLGNNLSWWDWTPTVTQSVAVAATVTEAKYFLVGKVCHAYAKLAVTAAGTGANPIQIGGQPAAMQPAVTGHNTTIGIGHVLDSGTSNYGGNLMPITATDWRIISDASGDYIGVAPNFALANGDKIDFTTTYRVA